jgi:serine/threonine protein kinase
MKEQSAFRVGQEPIPGYRLTQLLGKGSISEVWEAKKADQSIVALKLTPFTDRQLALAEQRAIETVAQLVHPKLIKLEQTWIVPGCYVVSMERAEATLQDLLEIHQQEFNSPLSIEQACEHLKQTAEVLDFLNARQHRLVDGRVVAFQHCDVKPSNLLLFGDVVKLSDFALSAATVSGMQAHPKRGTLDYAAPEVFQGQVSDHTDQYALAVTWVKLRTGSLPFPPTSAKGSWPRRRPAADLSKLTEKERPIIARAMAAQPQERWPKCREMLVQLDLAH